MSKTESSEQTNGREPEAQEEERSVTRRRVVIVGAGQTGRSLARILSESWDIAVLDTDQNKLDRLSNELPERGIRCIHKDGTSKLSLTEAGVSGAEWLVALTNIDDVNAEACRVGLTLDRPPTAIGVVRRPEHGHLLKQVGAEVISRPGAVAGILKNRIERAHQVASGVGLDAGEILEIPVLRSSPAVDARVRDLRARRWLVAAIYRDGRYVVPHGHVVIRESDRLLLTGEPEILPHIADYLRAGVARFPLQYGVRAVAYTRGQGTDAFWEEFRYLANHTRPRAARALATKEHAPPEQELRLGKLETQVVNATDDLDTIVRRVLPGLDCGCLVIQKEPVGFLARAGIRRPAFAEALDSLDCPLLLSAGTFPYKRILVPVLDPDASLLSTELAIDLARQLNVGLAAVTVTPPTFIVGQEAVQEQKEAFKTVMEIGSLYHIKIEEIAREGNPAKEVAAIVGEGDLIVVSHRAGRRASFFNPDTSLQIIVRSPCSVLALSHRERVHGAS
jgi:Trk K+ transport system NAD-binding subunit/nucleotide-binding universal stress UspA family protein